MFEAADIRRMIDGAAPQLKTMVLLAVNCGFGNADCAALPIRAIDLENAWIDFPRPKTGIERRCPLWPETVAALQTILANRRPPKDKAAVDSLFVTKYGSSWAGSPIHNPITKEFRKLLDELKLHRGGLGFYTLRHVFRTIGDGAKDQPAVRSIMGHADDSMDAVYREEIEDERLRAIANHVHTWLYPKDKAKSGQAAKAKSVGPRIGLPRRIQSNRR
jgi:integrase